MSLCDPSCAVVIAFEGSLACDDCAECLGRGWHFEVDPDTADDYIPGAYEVLCNCPLGEVRRRRDAGEEPTAPHTRSVHTDARFSCQPGLEQAQACP